ncbi:Mut7-C RNAse domain-containing protein [bacterium]|nr:Mut7-C RNAse domain-containing protein [bacterium]
MAGTDDRPAFIADAMLGRLARALRMLGLDTQYRPDIDDNELKMTALREGRVILTRDREVADTSLPVTVLLVESDHVEEQLLQTARAFRIAPGGRLFSRCLICNVEVEDVEKCEVRERVPEYVYETQERFSRCPSCGRIYWAGTHVERAREWLERVLGTQGRER